MPGECVAVNWSGAERTTLLALADEDGPSKGHGLHRLWQALDAERISCQP